METFSALLHFCAGKFTGHRWIRRTKAIDTELWYFSVICAWTNSRESNGDANDLRRHRAYYDGIVMTIGVMIDDVLGLLYNDAGSRSIVLAIMTLSL